MSEPVDLAVIAIQWSKSCCSMAWPSTVATTSPGSPPWATRPVLATARMVNAALIMWTRSEVRLYRPHQCDVCVCELPALLNDESGTGRSGARQRSPCLAPLTGDGVCVSFACRQGARTRRSTRGVARCWGEAAELPAQRYLPAARAASAPARRSEEH